MKARVAAVAAAAALAAGALTGCSALPTIVVNPPAAPSPAAVVATAAPAPAPAPTAAGAAGSVGDQPAAEAEFLRLIRLPDSGSATFRPMPDAQAISMGYSTCSLLAQIGPDSLMRQMSGATQTDAVILMVSGAGTLCPAQNDAVLTWLGAGSGTAS